VPFSLFADYCVASHPTNSHALFMQMPDKDRWPVMQHLRRRLTDFLRFDSVPHMAQRLDLVRRLDRLPEMSPELNLRYCHALFHDVSPLYELGAEAAELVLRSIVMGLSSELHREQLPLAVRLAVIEAAYYLFCGWYTNVQEYSYSCHFFWDSICYRYGYTPVHTSDQQAIQDALFQCIAGIIRIDNRQCQASALHGFNHLGDDRCQPIIDQFLRTCDDPRLAAYAGVCRAYRGLKTWGAGIEKINGEQRHASQEDNLLRWNG
jgi:hypothetical protein